MIDLKNAAKLPKPHFLDGIAKAAVHSRLKNLRLGRLQWTEGDQSYSFGELSERCTLSASVTVTDARLYSEMAFGGSIGAGEAYMYGYWQTDDLVTLLRILLQNRDVVDGMEKGLARWAQPFEKTMHWISRNTRQGSLRNIQAHYDLGNAFFKLFLDPTLMYSSAFFEHSQMTLEEASVAKLDRICKKLQLNAGDRILEIGTGWGGFALHAATHYGCHVTTTTISQEQHDLARERIGKAGLEGQITLLLSDYRDLQGQYDKLVSIEMIEAVGHAYYDTYFKKCSDLLKPAGQMLLQAITIADQRYEKAKNAVDFIQRYIFPGSCIPSVGSICDALTRVTDMKLYHLEDIGPHYAMTLRQWRHNFMQALSAVRSQGYSESFIRMWEFYFAYCEAGFMERVIGDVQMHLVKPQARPEVVTFAWPSQNNVGHENA